MQSPYKEAVRMGLPIESHESDLYIPATAEAIAMVKRSGYYCSTFWHEVKGGQWLDVPFAYEPFWRNRGPRS